MTIVLGSAARFGIAGALACGVLTPLMVAPAGATPGWLSPVGVSEEGPGVSRPRVAFDKQGDAVAVWARVDGKEANGIESYAVQAAFRPAGGVWHAPETISPPGESSEEPSIGWDGHGDVVVVWEAYNGVHFNVEAASKPVGGAWQAPVRLSANEAPGTARHPEVALDEQGNALAVWNRGGPFGGVVQAAFMPAGGAWQTPVEIAEIGDEPQVTFDGQGDALLLWYHYESGEGWGARSAFRPVGGAWQPPVNVAAGGIAEGLHLAVGGHGDAVAVWDRWTHGFLSYRVARAAFMPAGGVWQAPVDLSEEVKEGDEPFNREAREPAVAVDGQGNAVVVWGRSFGAQAAFRPAGGAWQAAVDLSAPYESAESPQVAFDAQGDAIAIWALQPSLGSTRIIQTAFKPAGGAWQAPVDIGHGGGPQVALDGQGDALAAWVGEGGVQAAGYVATGPVLNGISIPATGVAGQALSFSVAPFDVWSVSGETNWSFGDGSSASGTNATHTYTAAGTYEVTVHSADALDNLTSATSKITIAPEPTISTPPPSAPTSEPPTINAASQSSSTWRESGKASVGTVFSLSLNEQAAVSFRFLRGVSGRLASLKCVAKTSKTAARKVCKRTVVAGVLSFAGHSGTNKIAFKGRISRSKMLKPGRYELIVTATNSAGTSAPKSLSFTIAK
jgi:hypothetical protein